MGIVARDGLGRRRLHQRGGHSEAPAIARHHREATDLGNAMPPDEILDAHGRVEKLQAILGVLGERRVVVDADDAGRTIAHADEEPGDVVAREIRGRQLRLRVGNPPLLSQIGGTENVQRVAPRRFVSDALGAHSVMPGHRRRPLLATRACPRAG
jgi:hypothetical protein